MIDGAAPDRVRRRSQNEPSRRQTDGYRNAVQKASPVERYGLEMSSILTNTSAMIALQTLKSINLNLTKAQDEISTGKSIASSKDNAAVWAISKVMESDVSGFKAIASSLALGQSTVATARSAAERVTDLLNKVKEKIVAAQEENVDRAKIQDDISALRSQISGITEAAQFNGLNLLTNTSKTVGSSRVDILASLDRSSTGVKATSIAVGKQDLGQGAATAGAAATTVGVAATIAAGATAAFATFTGTPAAGNTYQITAIGGTALTSAAIYVAREGDTLANVRDELISRANFQAKSQGLSVTLAAGATDGAINLTNNGTAGVVVVAGNASQGGATDVDGKIGGGLEYLSKINVTTNDGAEAAMGLIERLIQVSIKGSAAFGSAQGRIEIQTSFVSALTDSLRAGIGSLVDADMEEASARLQALQVQQQLGVQALSIANQAPQTILSLFR